MSELYCKCDKPKIVKVHISHKTYDVCSKRNGGCGCEYSPEKLQVTDTHSNWSDHIRDSLVYGSSIMPISYPDFTDKKVDDNFKKSIKEHMERLKEQQEEMGKFKWNIPRDYKLPIIGSDSDD